MDTLSQHNPVGRFDGLAEVYARCRPSYPPAAIDLLVATAGLHPGSLVADIGSGTGISARQLAARGAVVTGIEPNADMRGQAKAAPWDGPGFAPHYQAGTAEATGLPDSTIDLVLSAQAFHWFKADAALQEFYRILKPNGWVALMWNERDEGDAATAAYGAVIRTAPQAPLMEGSRHRAGAALLACPLFAHRRRVDFDHEQVLDEEGMVHRALSASYAPRTGEDRDRFIAALRQVFARHQDQGQFWIRYQTSVYLGQKAAGACT